LVRKGTWAALAGAILLLGFSLPIYPNALQAWGNNLAATAVIVGALAWHLLHPLPDDVTRDTISGALPPTSGSLQPHVKDQP
jgi:hypothetical protein